MGLYNLSRYLVLAALAALGMTWEFRAACIAIVLNPGASSDKVTAYLEFVAYAQHITAYLDIVYQHDGSLRKTTLCRNLSYTITNNAVTIQGDCWNFLQGQLAQFHQNVELTLTGDNMLTVWADSTPLSHGPWPHIDNNVVASAASCQVFGLYCDVNDFVDILFDQPGIQGISSAVLGGYTDMECYQGDQGYMLQRGILKASNLEVSCSLDPDNDKLICSCGGTSVSMSRAACGQNYEKVTLGLQNYPRRLPRPTTTVAPTSTLPLKNICVFVMGPGGPVYEAQTDVMVCVLSNYLGGYYKIGLASKHAHNYVLSKMYETEAECQKAQLLTDRLVFGVSSPTQCNQGVPCWMPTWEDFPCPPKDIPLRYLPAAGGLDPGILSPQMGGVIALICTLAIGWSVFMCCPACFMELPWLASLQLFSKISPRYTSFLPTFAKWNRISSIESATHVVPKPGSLDQNKVIVVASSRQSKKSSPIASIGKPTTGMVTSNGFLPSPGGSILTVSVSSPAAACGSSVYTSKGKIGMAHGKGTLIAETGSISGRPPRTPV